ncbi:LOB domain-containing protein 24-like [Papaver somniferum]|uniref:LOB domain-containing protein 24-like n=1 Tax=Papaver somniferum TaxID=3469 RepID=UPI000E6FFBDC|nr:LOB domain-containing protein 24-like [Papaver somniferum]
MVMENLHPDITAQILSRVPQKSVSSCKRRKRFKFTRSRQGCAACKHQRKKCPPTCPLAPYFPRDKLSDFLNVREVFGVRNFLRLLEKANPWQQEAARTLIREADVRNKYPAVGMCGVSERLYRQLEGVTAERDLLREREILIARESTLEDLNIKFVAEKLVFPGELIRTFATVVLAFVPIGLLRSLYIRKTF